MSEVGRCGDEASEASRSLSSVTEQALSMHVSACMRACACLCTCRPFADSVCRFPITCQRVCFQACVQMCSSSFAAAACMTPPPRATGALSRRCPTFVAGYCSVCCVGWRRRDSARSNLSDNAMIGAGISFMKSTVTTFVSYVCAGLWSRAEHERGRGA